MDIFIPSLIHKKKGPFLSLELDVDYLPHKYLNEWSALVFMITKQWIDENEFKKPATIWLWCCQSVNFHHPHAMLSEFIIPLGFPKKFFNYLEQQLRLHLKGNVLSGYVANEAEWSVLCHTEQGRLWQMIDPVTWEEVKIPGPRRGGTRT